MERTLNRRAEALGGGLLATEGLDGLQGVQRLAGVAHGPGELVLGGRGQVPERAGEEEEGHDHDRDDQQHEQGQLGTDQQHEGQGADQDQEVAQEDRGRGRQQVLDDLDVCGQARQDLAGPGGHEEGGVEGQDVAVDVLAEVRDDPLAQARHPVIAQGREQAEGDRDTAQEPEPGIDRGPALVGRQVFDQQAHRAAHPQSRR
jgi:hypothetical protein